MTRAKGQKSYVPNYDQSMYGCCWVIQYLTNGVMNECKVWWFYSWLHQRNMNREHEEDLSCSPVCRKLSVHRGRFLCCTRSFCAYSLTHLAPGVESCTRRRKQENGAISICLGLKFVFHAAASRGRLEEDDVIKCCHHRFILTNFSSWDCSITSEYWHLQEIHISSSTDIFSKWFTERRPRCASCTDSAETCSPTELSLLEPFSRISFSPEQFHKNPRMSCISFTSAVLKHELEVKTKLLPACRNELVLTCSRNEVSGLSDVTQTAANRTDVSAGWFWF